MPQCSSTDLHVVETAGSHQVRPIHSRQFAKVMPMRFFLGTVVAGSIFVFAAVFERLSAAVWKLVKFNFDWDSPIYLNISMVMLFCIGTLLLCLAKVIYARGTAANKRGMLKWAIALDLASFAMIGGMLATGIARFTP